MVTGITAFYDNYTPVGDVLVMAMCLIFVILIRTTYINRTRNFAYLKMMIVLVFVAAVSDIFYHDSLNHIGNIPVILHYIPRAVFHLALFGNLVLYVMYMREPLHLDKRSDIRYHVISASVFILIFAYEIIGTATHTGFYIDNDNVVHTGFPVFTVGYVFYVGMVAYIIFKYRESVFKQVLKGVCFTIGVSLLVMVVQNAHGQTSFTTMTFVFPIYALLYLLHSNPYDIESGALRRVAFDDQIRSHHEKKRPMLIMSILLRDYDNNVVKYPKELVGIIRYFMVHFFRKTSLFELSGGRRVLLIDLKKNPDYKDIYERVMDEFYKIYPVFKIDYKIVTVQTVDELPAGSDYIKLLEFIEKKMSTNSVRYLDDKDIESYLDSKYILSELSDIHEKMDLNDERVEVFCQPVFNIRNGIYDTAEALMRLRLPELGLVFPDKFIPIAEENGYIQTLTKIILNKTCMQIKELIDEGYRVRRISVNFSVFDVRENDFCAMVESCVRNSGIDFKHIAIEITESQNEKDFELVKERISALKDSGIKFYLDDFGTGYSNFERIMELPFDIIKFDRSLVIASSSDEKIKAMVSHLAKMFNDMDYAVLYEGIEDENDEERCMNMSAKYLQGYKYSKPIPMEKLREYFVKADTQTG